MHMGSETSHDSSSSELSPSQVLVRRIILVGRACVFLSALFLYLSHVVDSDVGGWQYHLWAIFLMIARMCGLASFAIGGVAIYNRRWTEGVLLMLLSVTLPVIAFLMYGTI